MSVGARGPGAALQTPAARRRVGAFVAGACLNLAFAPFGWWPIAILAPAALFALIRGRPPRRAFGAGAAFGTGLFGFGTYWLYTCLHVFGLVPVWLTLLLQTVLVAAMCLYVVALCYLANLFWLNPARPAIGWCCRRCGSCSSGCAGGCSPAFRGCRPAMR